MMGYYVSICGVIFQVSAIKLSYYTESCIIILLFILMNFTPNLKLLVYKTSRIFNRNYSVGFQV